MIEQIGKMAVIEWIDCCYNSGNNYNEAELYEFKLATLRTIGWIIERDDSWLLYNEFNNRELTYRHIINIPKSGIQKINYLTEGRETDEPVP